MLPYMCPRTSLSSCYDVSCSTYVSAYNSVSSCYDVSSYYRKGSLFSDVEEEEEEDVVVGVAATQTLVLPSGLVYFTGLEV